MTKEHFTLLLAFCQ